MSSRDQELLDLLAAKATEGLDPSDQAVLDSFCQARARGITSFERETTALSMAFATQTETMPAHLRDRVAKTLHAAASVGPDFATAARAEAGISHGPVDAPRATSAVAQHTAPATTDDNVTAGPFGGHAKRPARSTLVPWLAAAAALALAVLGWWPRSGSINLGPTGIHTAAARRAALIETAPEALQLAWTATEDPVATSAQGDVVWSTERQRGFMRFMGLEPNDPNQAQYQLWIFDANQDERFPVDGGVFDVEPNGETIITIDPKIAVDQPTLFAVTVEKPGGVVVSSRERIVLVAQVG